MQKTILITGCSSGIGLDCAKTLHAMGWLVFASCRKQDDCDRLKGLGLESPRLDHADAQSITEALTYITHKTAGTLWMPFLTMELLQCPAPWRICQLMHYGQFMRPMFLVIMRLCAKYCRLCGHRGMVEF